MQLLHHEQLPLILLSAPIPILALPLALAIASRAFGLGERRFFLLNVG
jgi:hypothetical protein